jgi:pantoate--beta-alanine ligase
MKIIKSVEEMAAERSGWVDGPVGIVPTMGFLHEGHLALVEKCRADCQTCVVTIFLNPTQFGPKEDLDRYPRDIERDIGLLKERSVDVLFRPQAADMYPDDFETYVAVEKLSQVLCGQSRPGHFRGVTTVVLKLFNLVRPHTAYFGQKDAQQALIIKRMIADLNLGIQLQTLPTVRDKDGLALSSRNRYLSVDQRKEALYLPRALSKARFLINEGVLETARVRDEAVEELKKGKDVEIEYLEIVDLIDLQPRETIDPNNTLVAAAVRVGDTRLIDNFILGEI